jgi:Putative homoserine kinase type II (protein kinase fold)
MNEGIKNLIECQYGFRVFDINKLTIGAGSNTYEINTECGKYILKNVDRNETNNPQNEPALCDFLLQKGIPVSEFVKNKNGQFLWVHDGKNYHMQKFVDGITPKWHSAQDSLLCEAARTLAKIHTVLQGYSPLPVGIGENFYKFMTPERALDSYQRSYQHAVDINDFDSAEDLSFRVQLVQRITIPTICLDELTRRNTHGDYFISQLICDETKINAIIDWTTACIHPVVWEIVRFYVYAAPECKDGEINFDRFLMYVKEYLQYACLTVNDIRTMFHVFFHQIIVCDYYNQYYQSTADNKKIYLHQAILSTKLMRWFDKNICDLSSRVIRELCN